MTGLDIEAIKKRYNSYVDAGVYPVEFMIHAGLDVGALISEVERLGAEIEELRKDLTAFEANAAEVFCVLTGGRISKVNTLASVVIGEAEAYNERTCVADAWDEGYIAGDKHGYAYASDVTLAPDAVADNPYWDGARNE